MTCSNTHLLRSLLKLLLPLLLPVILFGSISVLWAWGASFGTLRQAQEKEQWCEEQ